MAMEDSFCSDMENDMESSFEVRAVTAVVPAKWLAACVRVTCAPMRTDSSLTRPLRMRRCLQHPRRPQHPRLRRLPRRRRRRRRRRPRCKTAPPRTRPPTAWMSRTTAINRSRLPPLHRTPARPSRKCTKRRRSWSTSCSALTLCDIPSFRESCRGRHWSSNGGVLRSTSVRPR